MNSSLKDRKIDFAEKKVLSAQARIIEQRQIALGTLHKLEKEAKGFEEIKKEWIEKKNEEEERSRIVLMEAKKDHRLRLTDIKIKFEQEREEKLREIKTKIAMEEEEIKKLQSEFQHEVSITRQAETALKAEHQVRLNAVLREEQSAMRAGVYRQKRFLEPNMFTMSLQRKQPLGMKKKR